VDRQYGDEALERVTCTPPELAQDASQRLQISVSLQSVSMLSCQKRSCALKLKSSFPVGEPFEIPLKVVQN
jgi:hypothetical protein